MRLLAFLLLFSCSSVWAQGVDRTLGLIQKSDESFEGYTLFSPGSDTNVYLINNCGELIHTWLTEYRPGNAVYLQPDGTLWRAGRLENQNIQAGGGGGIIQQLDWDSNVLWSFEYNTREYRAHHDFQILPNGNVLILAWVLKEKEEVLANGRNPELLSEDELWPEQIIEVKPKGTNEAEIVWEWNAWDHLIQDFDPTKKNYGVVSEHPEKIDLNYIRPEKDGADWLHANSVFYDQDRGQIMISVLFFDEIWVINHNTTTEEAKGEKGDLLYRWGNPQTYKMGTPEDQKLFGQHNAYWIPEGYPDAGKIMIFNNGQNREPLEYSSVVKIDPEVEDGQYQYAAEGTFSPSEFDWEYTGTPKESFYSRFISGAQQLPNGNVLVTDGAFGRFFEINPQGETVWEYINPITLFGAATQGSSLLNPGGQGINTVFRSTKYAQNYQAFVAQDLSPKGIIEIDETGTNPCFLILSVPEELTFNVFPNPASNWLNVSGFQGTFEIYDLRGVTMLSGELLRKETPIDISNLKPGVYLLLLENQKPMKFIKTN